MKISMTLAAAVAVAILMSCNTPTGPNVTVTSLALSPSSLTLSVGDTQAVTVSATYSDKSTKVVTNSVWATANTSVATVSAGTITATGVGGPTWITVYEGGQSTGLSVTVSPATLNSLAVSPTSTTLAIGGTQAVTVTGTYSDSTTRTVTNAVWTTSNGSVATVSSGTITAVAAGTATITATKSGQSATVSVTVSAGPVSSSVYQITGTASSQVAAQVDFAVASGKTLTHVSLTYAIDSSFSGGGDWKPDGTWVENFVNPATTASSWTTVTCSTTLSATNNLEVEFYMQSGHLYLKELDLTYSDTSTQTLTFSTAAGGPVHSVLTPAAGSPVTSDSGFNWTYFDPALTGLVTDVTTVPF